MMSPKRIVHSARTRLARRPMVIWAVGVGVYLLAVFNRTTLGIAGPPAPTDSAFGRPAEYVRHAAARGLRRDADPGRSPDRPLRATPHAAGRHPDDGGGPVGVLPVDSYPLALVARGVLGCGDAMTYVCVLRLVAGWFPARRYPVMATFTSFFGMAGNVVATVPLTIMLTTLGWGPTFAIAGGLSLVFALCCSARRCRARTGRPESSDGPLGGRKVLQEVRSAWRMPAGRLGFWVHLSAMAGPDGVPRAVGLPVPDPGTRLPARLRVSLLLLLVVGGCAGTCPWARAQSIGRASAVRWRVVATSVPGRLAALILWPGGHPPAWVVVVLVCSSPRRPGVRHRLHARPRLQPADRISTATGLVNVGGFCGTW